MREPECEEGEMGEPTSLIRGNRLRVAMLGSSRKVCGGMTSVVDSLLPALAARGVSIRYIPTHVDGSKIAKALLAAHGGLRLVLVCLFRRCDIVHIHMSAHASFFRKSAMVGIAKFFRRRTLLHVHGSRFDVFYEGSGPSVRSRIRKVLERVDIVIALSDSWRSRLAGFAPEAEIRVLPNPVVADDFAPAVASRADVPADGGTVLFLGAFGKRKGIYDLIEAMSVVVARRPGVRFELGGDKEVEEVQRLTEQSGVAGSVRMLGWVTGGDKIAAFTRAHIYVLPSYHEGLPIGVLEALAAGLPVVTTPVGGIPEVVKDGVNGLIISPGDVKALGASILRLLEDAELRERMSGANVELVRSHHDAPIVAATLCEWYDEVRGR
jgi:glycosyltransferase involved in cell wall biosynthesis